MILLMRLIRIIWLVCFLLHIVFADNWENVKYFRIAIAGTNNYWLKKTYKDVLYNSYMVEIDDYGRRACTLNKQAKRYALFLGCSVVFGDGVENKDTLPQLFQNAAPEYQAYNYGFSGEGPNGTFCRFSHTDIRKEISQKNGICLFFYPVGWHEDRVRLHSNTVRYNENAPYYEYKNERLIYKGSLKKAQWFLYDIIRLYLWLPIPEKYRQVFPKCPTDKDYLLIADILCGIRAEYKKQFHSDNFYVVIHPFSNEAYTRHAIEILQGKDLTVIVLRAPKRKKEYVISIHDAHPNAPANKLIAKALADRLRLVIPVK
jgi:hypothetical protein